MHVHSVCLIVVLSGVCAVGGGASASAEQRVEELMLVQYIHLVPHVCREEGSMT